LETLKKKCKDQEELLEIKEKEQAASLADLKRENEELKQISSQLRTKLAR
jgi:hypothetical protein